MHQKANEVINQIYSKKRERNQNFIFSQDFTAYRIGQPIRFWKSGILDILATDEYLPLYPPEQPFRINQYRSVAVVGNSGTLLNSKLGEEIDRHDCVIRFNSALTKGFESDVGSKTTIRFSIGTLRFSEGLEYVIRSYRKGDQPARDIDFLKKDRVLVMTDEFAMFCQYLKEDSHSPICSTGWIGVIFALMVGQTVSLYGFDLPDEKEPTFDYHYYNKTRYVEKAHDFKKEHTIYQGFTELIPQKFKWHKGL